MTDTIECSYEDILSVKELTPLARQNLKNIIEKEQFTSYTVSVKDILTNGGNYFGSLQTVTVKDKSANSDKELNLFLKNIIASDSGLNVKEVYMREGFFYTELLKIFEKIQDKYNIPQEERFNAVKGYGEKNGAVIILEDISKFGYKTYDRFDVVTLKFAELAIEQLAKLHALSFVLQKEHPIYFENNIKPLNTSFQFNTEFENHMRRIFDIATETLENDAKTKLDIFFPTAMEKFRKYIDVSADQAVCLVHGDFRANNILVKEIDGEPTKAVPVDYQFLTYGYPVTDFIYFIFTGTDQKFRKNHLEHLKEWYYSTFDKFLSKFDIDASGVYSKKQFEESYREMLDFGLIVFLMLMPFIFATTDDIPELAKGLESLKLNMDECFQDRLHGIVNDFIQWGYL